MDLKGMINWKYILGFAVLMIIVFVAANSVSNYFFMKQLGKAAANGKTPDEIVEEEADKVRTQQSLA